MVDTVLGIMRARYRTLISAVSSLEKQREKLADGSINIRKHRNKPRYYLHLNKRDKYLGQNDTELIRELIQKDLIDKAIKAATHEAEVLKNDIIRYPKLIMEKVYETLPEERKEYASPIILGDEEYAREWLAVPFKPKPFRKDAPKLYTLKGERVRSKSEVIIADRLFAKGIPYKYECPLRVGNGIIHPDFTILRMSDRKVVYHEHCGKMTDPEYTKDILERANKYARIGIFQGDRLFYTFESAECPLDIEALNAFIENNFR